MSESGEVLRAYANRLQRGQEYFDELLLQAAARGLRVSGTLVAPPLTSLSECPHTDSPREDIEEYQEYVAKVTVYNELATLVGTWWGELEAWLFEHMVPLLNGIEGFENLPSVLRDLALGNEDVVDFALTHESVRTRNDLLVYRTTASRMQSAADRFSAGLKSGNPAVKAAAIKADPRSIRGGLRELTDDLAKVTKVSKVIPVAGGILTIVTAGVEIAEGGSPSSVGVGVLAGVGGGAGGGSLVATLAAIAGAAAPPVLVAVGVTVGSIAAGQLGRWMYEAWIPLDVRETVNDFFLNPPSLVGPTGTWAVGAR